MLVDMPGTGAVRKWGESPFRVAVIHGGPGAPGSVAAVARELAHDFGVLEPLQLAASVDGQAEELRAQLAAHADPPVTLIGCSWGAWLALILAACYPHLVRKLILVGSGPFEAAYAERIEATRLDRLNEAQREESRALMTELAAGVTGGEDRRMARLGELMATTDDYRPLPHEPDGAEPLAFQPEVHASVWREAAQLRQSGELLGIAKCIRCPVVAIHGDYDPHPAEGVEKPLSAILPDFRFILLEHCGHEPWREREARDPFFHVVRNELR